MLGVNAGIDWQPIAGAGDGEDTSYGWFGAAGSVQRAMVVTWIISGVLVFVAFAGAKSY